MAVKPFRRFLALPATERRLLVGAVSALSLVRCGLGFLRLRRLRRLLSRLGTARPTHLASSSPARIGWAVELVGRYMPIRPATCLEQGLAVQFLLARHGYPARLHIGVARFGGGGMQAHAWVDSGGAVVIGDSPVLGRFVTLTVLEP